MLSAARFRASPLSQRDLTPCDFRRNRRYRVIVFASSLSKDHRTKHSLLLPTRNSSTGVSTLVLSGSLSQEARCSSQLLSFLLVPVFGSPPSPFFWIVVFLSLCIFSSVLRSCFPPSLFCYLGFEALLPTSISVSCVFFFFFCFRVCSLLAVTQRLFISSRRLPILVFSCVL